MGRLAKLTAMTVQRINKKGRYADGGGLYLQVSDSGTKSWLFRYMLNSRSREMGLGPLALVSLAEARARAQEARRLLEIGKDPLEHKKENERAKAVEEARLITFEACASAYISAHGEKWKNPKHRLQWESTLNTYAFPVIGDLSVGQIDTALVLRVLEPIWHCKTETASRLRGRIENVLSYASVREWRQGENPARWRGHLDQLLPRRGDIAKVEHHAALPVKDVPEFFARLVSHESVSALALEFLILTASRTGEAINARWSEFDLQGGVWTVPGERMKHGKAHRVPLCGRTIEIVRALGRIAQSDFVFPGRRPGKPLSDMSLLALLQKSMKLQVTSHGFRSTFRDWAAEQTNYANEVVEMALAHTIESKVEAAYRRGDLFSKRRQLMDDWASYCRCHLHKVIPMRSTSA